MVTELCNHQSLPILMIITHHINQVRDMWVGAACLLSREWTITLTSWCQGITSQEQSMLPLTRTREVLRLSLLKHRFISLQFLTWWGWMRITEHPMREILEKQDMTFITKIISIIRLSKPEHNQPPLILLDQASSIFTINAWRGKSKTWEPRAELSSLRLIRYLSTSTSRRSTSVCLCRIRRTILKTPCCKESETNLLCYSEANMT